MKKTPIIELFSIGALILASCSVLQPGGGAVKAPLPNQPGPYKAGFIFNIFYDTDRTSPNTPEGGMPVLGYIFYPANPADGEAMPTALYPTDPLGLKGGLPPDPSTDWEQYGLDPAYQEIPPAQDGPFPLLIFSTGLTSPAEICYQIGARLASYGFVVVILPNYGDGAYGEPQLSEEDFYSYWTAIDRVLNIQYMITQMLKMNDDPSALLYQRIQPDQIAVSGHSWGGYAALAAVSGDRWFCSGEFQYPCMTLQPDPRIKVTLPIDGGSFLLSFESLEKIKIPHMTINREWDTPIKDAPWIEKSNFARQHAAIQGQPNYRVDISEALHLSFTNACASWTRDHDLGKIDEETYNAYKDEFCYPSPEHTKTVGDLTTMYMIAFLKANLTGDHSYDYILTPDYALKEQPLVEFFDTEKLSGKPKATEMPYYFSYLKHQPSDQLDQALKDPMGKP